ncbi:MAG: HisA/HisF-related TIM barrel protein, partial [cyanobacterium endosymbiont of Rhopalodia yunnanensis]
RIDAIEWAQEVERRGAGELLVTSMDADGTQTGYDLELIHTIAERVEIPVIASGGAGNCQHIYESFSKGRAEAALLASLLHCGKLTIREVKEYLRDRQVPVRGT